MIHADGSQPGLPGLMSKECMLKRSARNSSSWKIRLRLIILSRIFGNGNLSIQV
jgi:hypothetical protein